MKNIRMFLSENFQFWVLKFSVYLNRRVFVMITDRSKAVLSLWYFLLIVMLCFTF